MKQQPEVAKVEREMKDLIKADVNRTCQEFEYFRKQETKDLLQSLLFLWGREHANGYKQGMNEIMAVLLAVCDTERFEDQFGLFDPKYLAHDVYAIFTRLYEIGLGELYTEGKDIADVRTQMRGHQDEKTKLFQMSFEPTRA